eukprot:TRINITY_DN10694_c0_g1_i2.p2 TRINITY_DN10694_c0_g1~~TRINITY_DN10694_c0_g1_i2.p2  ORF type:complete len:112 (-),score=9.55 TRINITY_DN10694_c0_g1_i2:203-538(-)
MTVLEATHTSIVRRITPTIYVGLEQRRRGRGCYGGLRFSSIVIVSAGVPSTSSASSLLPQGYGPASPHIHSSCGGNTLLNTRTTQRYPPHLIQSFSQLWAQPLPLHLSLTL